MSHSNAEKLMIKKEGFFPSVLFPTSASSPPRPCSPTSPSRGSGRRRNRLPGPNRKKGKPKVLFSRHVPAAAGGGVGYSRSLCLSSAVFPAADSAPAAQDFNKKHITVSNALSGLHYRARASPDPVVPYDFISDEPYLLSKRFHLNSINLSKLSWANSSAASPAPGTGGTCSHAGPGFRGAQREPPRSSVGSRGRSWSFSRDPP